MIQTEAIPILVQIPLLGAFIWFALRLSSDYRADAKNRDEQWKSFLEQQSKASYAFIEQQNALWRGFIKDMIETSARAEDMTAQRIAELAGITKALHDDLKSHDQRTTGRGVG